MTFLTPHDSLGCGNLMQDLAFSVCQILTSFLPVVSSWAHASRTQVFMEPWRLACGRNQGCCRNEWAVIFPVLHIRKQCTGLPTARKCSKYKKYSEERGWNRFLSPARAAFPSIHGHSWDKGIAGLLWYIEMRMCLGDLRSRGETGNLKGPANGLGSAKDKSYSGFKYSAKVIQVSKHFLKPKLTWVCPVTAWWLKSVKSSSETKM